MKNGKFVKTLALVMALCLLVAGFAGCGAGNSKKTLVMGTNAEFPPFEYYTEDGLIDTFDGIDIAIAKEIGAQLDANISIDNMPFESLLIALAQDKIDFVAAGMTVKPERLENADFSISYYTATQVIIAKEGTAIASAADLTGKAVGVVLGYTGDVIVTALEGVTVERYKKGTDAVMDLVNGKVDAVVIDAAPAASFVEKNAGLTIIKDAAAFENEEYAIAVKKGNTELLGQINGVLEELLANGSIAEFGAKYAVAEEAAPADDQPEANPDEQPAE